MRSPVRLCTLLCVACALTLLASAESVAAQNSPVSRSPLLPIQKDGRWGYIDRAGKVVIPPRFDSANEFSDELALVNYGREPLPDDGDAPFITDPYLVDARTTGGEWGYIDTAGEVVIKAKAPIEFMGGMFTEGLAKISTYVPGRGSVWGYMNKTGRIVIKPQFTYAEQFREGLAAACVADHQCGFIDRSGVLVIKPKHHQTYGFSEGLGIVVTGEDRAGFVDRTGRIVIEPQYGARGGMGFRGGLSTFTPEGGERYGFIDKDNVLVIEARYETALAFLEGLAAVRLNGVWGYIDKEGETVIAARFLEAAPFSEGLAAVRTESGYGYIDKTGKMIVEPRFGAAYPFADGAARVLSDGGWGYIDQAGKYIWQPTR